MNPSFIVLEAIIATFALLGFLFFFQDKTYTVDYGMFFIEDVYASLIALDNLNQIKNATAVCGVVRYIVPKEYNITVKYNDTIFCMSDGKSLYNISYLILDNGTPNILEIKILK